MKLESYRRFYSHWIHAIWFYRVLQCYYDHLDVRLNTAVLFLYGVMGGCDYAICMYDIWHNRLHAVGEDPKVADKFSIYEFAVAFLASFSSAYWLLETVIPVYVWFIVLVLSWVGHTVLARVWRVRISKLRHTAYRHVPI